MMDKSLGKYLRVHACMTVGVGLRSRALSSNDVLFHDFWFRVYWHVETLIDFLFTQHAKPQWGLNKTKIKKNNVKE